MSTSAHYPLPRAADLGIPTLGPCKFPTPVAKTDRGFVDERARVLLSSDLRELRASLEGNAEPPSFEPAGPRSQVFFDPGSLGCGIVTCGGLCPGLNCVIRAIVLTLHHSYGVRKILGFRYGYAGLVPDTRHAPVELGPEAVERIHEQGGTILGSSRGPQDLGAMADTLVRHGIGILFAVGGDGTLRGASALGAELRGRGAPVSVVGIPKTIDNDLAWTRRSFGFTTAVAAAQEAIDCAHAEARGALNGVGLVKLMGRHSGFIAAEATLSSADVNFCLVPEVPFELDGDRGFLRALERRLDEKRHAVVVVAEGAGQDWLQTGDDVERDASGNVKLKDVGIHLRTRIGEHFSQVGKEVDIKYIDPSYTIRSLPANAFDSAFCLVLGQHAVHAGVAGRTDLMVGVWNGEFVHIPIQLGVARRNQLEESGWTWQRVLETTGQPASMRT